MLHSRKARAQHGHSGCYCCDWPVNNRTLRSREKRAWQREIERD